MMIRTRFFSAIVFALGMLVGAPPVSGNDQATPDQPKQSCETIRFETTPFTICTFDAGLHTIKLFHSDPEGAVFRHFDVLEAFLDSQKMDLVFAMNAGMYHDNRDAVGLLIEDGIERSKLNRNPGPGNFHLLPNGVFYVDGDRAGVAESNAFSEAGIEPDFATQSGPMLVINGKLHPRFIKDGTSRKIRNGVGVSGNGRTVTFALSEAPVNFHDFGRLFRDRLNMENALFLDGSISRLYARELNRSDYGRAMGPIVGIVEDLPIPEIDDETK